MLMSRLDRDINLCHDYMSRSHVTISCRDQMSIFQLDFPFLLLSISQYLAICIYHCLFQLDFPFFAVKHFSKLEFCIYECFSGLDFLFQPQGISQNWLPTFANAYLDDKLQLSPLQDFGKQFFHHFQPSPTTHCTPPPHQPAFNGKAQGRSQKKTGFFGNFSQMLNHILCWSCS